MRSLILMLALMPCVALAHQGAVAPTHDCPHHMQHASKMEGDTKTSHSTHMETSKIQHDNMDEAHSSMTSKAKLPNGQAKVVFNKRPAPKTTCAHHEDKQEHACEHTQHNSGHECPHHGAIHGAEQATHHSEHKNHDTNVNQTNIPACCEAHEACCEGQECCEE